MRTALKAGAGIGIMLLLLIGARGLYPADPLRVVYASSDGGNLTIKPIQPYSHPDGNGFLVVDISPDSPFYPGVGEGLSVNSTYVFEDVFEIENNQSETGYSEICVLVSSSDSKMGFFVGSFNGTWSDSVEFTVEAGESVELGVRINTEGLSLGDYWGDFTIEAWGGACK
ncbi:DUF1102 domain-containing protein [Thermococcus sp.]